MVVWSLQKLFDGPDAKHLIFKGGTSLSKAYGVIRRFSEDIDLTYDIRAIASDLIGDTDAPLPATKSQERKWSKEIRARLSTWVSSNAAPLMSKAIEINDLPATVIPEGDKVFIKYEALVNGTGYVKPEVMLEFGARSTGEPSEKRNIICDAATYLANISFPTAIPKVMRAERTFWEKATAIHVFCAQGAFRGGDRFARHWHDIVRLDGAGFAAAAMADNDLAMAVADHKSIFFAEKDTQGNAVDYHAAVSGGLQLAPTGAALILLEEDYRRMVDDGLLLEDAEPFSVLLEHCRTIQNKANGI